MKRLFLAATLLLCLSFAACSGPITSNRSNDKSIASSISSNADTLSSTDETSAVDDSLPTSSIEAAEETLITIYKPMILYLPVCIDSETPISPENAYDSFQCYAICQKTARNEDYNNWLIQGEDEYDLYYSRDSVETFLSSYFGIPAETTRKMDAYVAEQNGYCLNIYSGKDTSVLDITNRVSDGDVYTFSFFYSDLYHNEPTECILSLREYEGGFTLEYFERTVPIA